MTATPKFKPPTLTSAAQRRAEELAERVDYWRTAHQLISADPRWHEGYDPFDVLALANFLAGKPSE